MSSKLAEGHDKKPASRPDQTPKPKGVSDLVRSFNIPMLKYDANAPSNWSAFLKALSTVAGIAYCNLFIYVQDEALPVFETPRLKSCDREKELDLMRIDALYPDQTSPEYLDAFATHIVEFNFTAAEKEARNTEYLEDYRNTRKEIIELNARIYSLIKANCSPESLQCVSARLLDLYEIMDREMDPLLPFKTLKETHTAFGTPNPPTLQELGASIFYYGRERRNPYPLSEKRWIHF
jgi:hypothetical protein